MANRKVANNGVMLLVGVGMLLFVRGAHLGHPMIYLGLLGISTMLLGSWLWNSR